MLLLCFIGLNSVLLLVGAEETLGGETSYPGWKYYSDQPTFNGIWREAVLWKILLTCISILFSSRKVASCLELGHVAKMSSKILISSILGFGSKTDVGQETQVNIRAGR